MKQQINLTNNPNQEFNFDIGQNSLDIRLRTMGDGSVIMDLLINNEPEFYGKRCCDRTPLIINNKLGGNLYFMDLYGNENPNYKKYNERFLLIFDDELSYE
jgi:hypothetical protein